MDFHEFFGKQTKAIDLIFRI